MFQSISGIAIQNLLPRCYPGLLETRMKLSDRQIRNLKAKPVRYEVWEGNGFGIRVSPSGKKSWIYVYRFNNKPRRITFGCYPRMSVAEAHAAHGNALAALEKGSDPGASLVVKNIANRLAPTVMEFAREYMEKWAKQRKRSWEDDERMLNKDVIPIIGTQKMKDVTKRDIILLLDKIMKRNAPIAANRTFEVIRRMFNFAVERDIITITPCYGVKAPAKKNRRDRSLTTEEIVSFWTFLDIANMSELTRLALKLLLSTAQRRSEMASAKWSEFDLTNGWWIIAGNKTKNGKEHRVPISSLTLQLLLQVKTMSGESEWLFPSPLGNTHFLPGTISNAIRRNRSKLYDTAHFTAHDLRRTAASHMTAIGVPRLVVSKLLNHVENSVTAIYDRHGYDNEKKDAMEKWGARLQSIVPGQRE